MKPLPINMLGFESAVLRSKIPVLVVFGAIWDYGSSALFNHMVWYGEKLDGKMKTAIADIDVVIELFYKYEIIDLPTMVIFENGEPFKKRKVGYYSDTDIDEFLYSFFGYLPYESRYKFRGFSS